MCLCEACTSEFEKSTQVKCRECGKPYRECPCVPKALFDVGIKEARCLFAYDTRSHNTAADRVIYSLKRATNRDATVFLSRLLAERISSDFTREGRDIRAFTIAYAPRRPASIREYGSDHMKAVAKETARILGIERADLFKSKVTSAQKTLTADKRALAAKKGYALRHSASPSIQGKSFILIDDIITTGATLAACVSLLKSADVGKICVYCIAKSK
jgi:predicted amidophosphoribosyltransferase